MEMTRPVHAVKIIRTALEDLQGATVKIRANMGRSKVLEREGIVLQTHPALFVVEVREKRDRKVRASYQYVDVLTGSVELSHPESGEALFPWIELAN